MYGRLYRRNSIEFKERTERDASVMLEMELNRLRQSGKLGPTADKWCGRRSAASRSSSAPTSSRRGPTAISTLTCPRYSPCHR